MLIRCRVNFTHVLLASARLAKVIRTAKVLGYKNA